MGKRLQRFSGTDLYTHQLELVNTELHIILLSGAPFHGVIEKWDQHVCYFKDSRDHTQRILISDIAEIVTDKTASY